MLQPHLAVWAGDHREPGRGALVVGLLDPLEGGLNLLGEHVVSRLLHGHEDLVGEDGGVDVRPLCRGHVAPDPQIPRPDLEGQPVLG
jgi:hypothetical protein